jgi:ATP-dependent DNA helicase RecG
VLPTLESKVTLLAGVGPKIAEKLFGLGIERVTDLLFHLPLRYEDRTTITAIDNLDHGQHALVEGEILSTRILYGARRSLDCAIMDESGTLHLRFFHFTRQQQDSLQAGHTLRCFGEVRHGRNGLEMIHPEYQRDPDPAIALPKGLTPVYPSTEGLTQNLWRKLQQQAIAILARETGGTADRLALSSLPPALAHLDLSFRDALLFLHSPPPETNLAAIASGNNRYRQRLAFEELVAHQLSLLKLRGARQALLAPSFSPDSELGRALVQNLPFSLTNAQQRTIREIGADCAQSRPMLRLVQGDVGSGKTVVAAVAAANAIAAGFQVAIMAPTEILAEQHLASFLLWFSPIGIRVEWLVGRHTPKQKREILQRLASGETQVLLGTHAVFQEHVVFQRLGLVIIDEQHRFGVHQRLALLAKGSSGFTPHQLIMTATPIPRTLAMAAYADLDLSVIDELPPGRKPVTTLVMEERRRHEIIDRIRHACEEGRQAYWVCTLIEESEVLNCQAAEKTAELLRAELSTLRVGLVHGRLKPAEKAATMELFARGEIDLLVATTVIEVGVNVPNASIMVIENPERLGLAQLHQLRGRVGRGEVQSYCLLLYQNPLTANAKERLEILRQTNDGFLIAETDLKLRGPGEVLGTRQTGILQYRIADLARDEALLQQASEHAHTLLEQGATTNTEALIRRWITDADYFAQG